MFRVGQWRSLLSLRSPRILPHWPVLAGPWHLAPACVGVLREWCRCDLWPDGGQWADCEATVGVWVYNPHAGGRPVPAAVRLRTQRRIQAHADANYAGRFLRIDIRFRGALCYVDACVDDSPAVPVHLCRLRFFGNEAAWSFAFYTYSHERYEPSVFANGTFLGTPEEAFDLAAVYL